MLEEKYPQTFQYLERFHQLGSEEWYAYYTAPAPHPGEAIVSCKIVSPRSFARMELSDKTIHGSAFGIAVKDERVDIRLLLLYLNSKHFWSQLDATMPPMGTGRRAIRISILKDLLIPKRIAYPTEESIVEARNLEKRISQTVGRKKSKETEMAFRALDSFIDQCLSK